MEARNSSGQFFVFFLICQPIMLIKFIAIKKHLLGKKLDLLSFRRNIAGTYCHRYLLPSLLVTIVTYYHRYKRSQKFALSFLALRKSDNVSSEVRYDSNSHWIVKGNQRRRYGCHKATKCFCEKCNVALYPECFKIFPQK